MAFKRLSSWFVSESGRKFFYISTGAAGLGAFCAQYIPHTICIDQYRDIVQLYKQGLSVPVPANLQARFRKALELADIPKDEVRLYKPFSVFGFDIFHAGSSFSRFGVYVGLPVNFSYTDVDSIEKHKIKILGESVCWELPEAKDFLDALVLSENAQLYAISREMLMTQNLKIIVDSLYASFAVFFTYGLSRYLNDTYKFLQKPLSLRLILYSLVTSMAAMNYCLLKDVTQLHYEKAVDEQLRSKNPDLAKGAVEFYSKLLKRNVALRKLMGSEGEHVYTVLGNDVYWIRQKHLPLAHRKAFFEDYLKNGVQANV